MKIVVLPQESKRWRARVDKVQAKLADLPFANHIFRILDRAQEVVRWQDMKQLPLKTAASSGRAAEHSRFDYVERFVTLVCSASFVTKEVPSEWCWDEDQQEFMKKKGKIWMGDLLICWFLLLQYGHLHDGHVAERFFLYQLYQEKNTAQPTPQYQSEVLYFGDAGSGQSESMGDFADSEEEGAEGDIHLSEDTEGKGKEKGKEKEKENDTTTYPNSNKKRIAPEQAQNGLLSFCFFFSLIFLLAYLILLTIPVLKGWKLVFQQRV